MRTSERGHHSGGQPWKRIPIKQRDNDQTLLRRVPSRSLASSHRKTGYPPYSRSGDKERDTGVVPRDLHLTVSPSSSFLLSSAAFLQSSNSSASYSERTTLSLSLSLSSSSPFRETGRQTQPFFLIPPASAKNSVKSEPERYCDLFFNPRREGECFNVEQPR